jgi:hypothetical protein
VNCCTNGAVIYLLCMCKHKLTFVHFGTRYNVEFREATMTNITRAIVTTVAVLVYG